MKLTEEEQKLANRISDMVDEMARKVVDETGCEYDAAWEECFAVAQREMLVGRDDNAKVQTWTFDLSQFQGKP